jgi:hypothetical protein
VVARETFLFFHNARPPVYRKWVDRDKRTGQLVEKELRPPLFADPDTVPEDYKPIDPGSEGEVYVVTKGEAVPAGHPAVLAAPELFDPDTSEE